VALAIAAAATLAANAGGNGSATTAWEGAKGIPVVWAGIAIGGADVAGLGGIDGDDVARVVSNPVGVSDSFERSPTAGKDGAAGGDDALGA
jgi:hypothetical protein